MLVTCSKCYSFDLLENSDSNCKASIMLPATFNCPEVNAYTNSNKVDDENMTASHVTLHEQN